MKVWVNGEIVDESQARVSAFDHGITVGDGVFETVKVVDGVPFALSRHLGRLAVSAYGLGLETPPDTDLRRAVAETLAANAEHHGRPMRLRITLTGGTAPLGSDRGGAAPTLLVAMAATTPWPPSARLVLVPWTRNETSATVGLKTTSYAENVVALAHAKAHNGDEAVFANTAGNLCEGTGSNIFLVRGGEVVTPPLSSGCLAGVTRALLVEWADVVEREVPVAALLDADEVFLTSSTRDVQAVHGIGDHEIEPGPVTALLAAEFARRAGADADP